MKKLVVIAACVGATAMAFGQGTFNLNNRQTADGINAIVTHMDGMTAIDGADGWVVQAWVGADAGSLAPVGTPVEFRTGAAQGYFAGGAVDAGVANGTEVMIQVAAWNINDGADVLAAQAAGGAVGLSIPVTVTVDGPPNTPPNLVGLEPWMVSAEVIPEPSTFALGLLGIGALMLRRRK
jgi:hypothetical protein